MKAKKENLVNNERNKLEQVVPLATPYLLFIDVSDACNFKCKFCGMQTSDLTANMNKQIMDLDLFKKIIDDIAEFPDKLKMLRVSGHGEPLLNKNLPEMIKYAKDKNVSEYIEFVTNGSYLNPALNRKLVEAGIDRIRVSIEAVTEEGYKEISGVKINLNEFINNLKDLYEHKGNTEIYIKTVDCALKNQDEIDRYYELFGDICDRIFIDNVIPHWPGWDEMSDNEEYERGTVGVHGQEVKEVKVCPYIFYYMWINPDGVVSPCTADWLRKNTIGNVNEESLMQIWKGESLKRMQIKMLSNQKKELECCKECLLPNYDSTDNIDDYAGEMLQKIL